MDPTSALNWPGLRLYIPESIALLIKRSQYWVNDTASKGIDLTLANDLIELLREVHAIYMRCLVIQAALGCIGALR